VRVCVRVVTFMHKNNEGGTGHKFSITVNVIIIIFRLVDSTIFTVCFQTLKY
jgi:heme/copper-type cytochrome/quinol oxidase subunit 4